MLGTEAIHQLNKSLFRTSDAADACEDDNSCLPDTRMHSQWVCCRCLTQSILLTHNQAVLLPATLQLNPTHMTPACQAQKVCNIAEKKISILCICFFERHSLNLKDYSSVYPTWSLAAVFVVYSQIPCI